MTSPRVVLSALVLAAASLAPGAARAETYHTCAGFIDALPAVITTQGIWCLRKDLSTAVTTGIAISIDTNNVTIDCNGYKLGGLGGGLGTMTAGIYSENRLNATVRNCNIRGFRNGILLSGDDSGGHVVEHNRLDASRVAGIEVHGDGSVIRDNLVFDTGLSTLQSQYFGIATLYNVDVRDNTVDGIVQDNATVNGSATGILMQANTRGVAVGNRIAGLVSVGTGTARGIYHNSSQNVAIVGNVVVGDARANGIGIRCTSFQGVARDNIILEFLVPVENCTGVDNTTPT